MLYKNWAELEAAFKNEMLTWIARYPSKPYVERIIKKVFHHYSSSDRAPKTPQDWKRAIEYFLEKNWTPAEVKKKDTNDVASVPKRVFQATSKPVGQCSICQDRRVVVAVAKDGTHETLMLCECTALKPDLSDWALAVYTHKWAPLYTRTTCPVEWFVPKPEVGETVGQKALSWREKIRLAETFWAKPENVSK